MSNRESETSSQNVGVSFLSGAAGKFAESIGSGLAYGIVILCGITIAKLWLFNNPIVRLTEAKTVCGRNETGKDCQVFAMCDDDEVAIGGECSVSESYNKEFILHNFGLYANKSNLDDHTPRIFICNWGGDAANSDRLLIPHVRAACVKKSLFQPSLSFGKS